MGGEFKSETVQIVRTITSQKTRLGVGDSCRMKRIISFLRLSKFGSSSSKLTQTQKISVFLGFCALGVLTVFFLFGPWFMIEVLNMG